MKILRLKKVVYKVKKSYGLFDIKYMIITMTNWKLYFHWKPFRHLKVWKMKMSQKIINKYTSNTRITVAYILEKYVT